MTAVASPPSLQPLSRLGWNSGKSSEGGLDSGSTAGEVSRIFGARKVPQRTSSASSVNTVLSDTSTQNSTSTNTTVDDLPSNGSGSGSEQEGKQTTKSGRTLWNPQKAEATVAASNDRPASASPTNSVNSTQLTEHQAQLVGLAPQAKMQQSQTNGTRVPQGQANADPPALLVLLPMNGTFERKQITVPYFPDILRIGRQTNAKTVPTPANGYFDSKVLSRQHAEVWADRMGKIWIRDVKSSNGTFVNGVRLSPESRDSEPHELRDNDMLELGIDIVSEDQKSIVHHKVSAKIEHAGIQANPSSVLDLNLGDIDPGSGGGLMGGLLPGQQHMRGRGGSQGSMGSSGRMSVQSMNGGVNGVGVQRHMNAWLGPVSIEQVVKRLGHELKQARQQANDLHRTSDFFQEVLNSPPGQELPKPPASMHPAKPQTNGISPKKTEVISPFSQPPAPPPQQPLPEKPDASQQLPFRRTDNDKLNSPKSSISPSKVESSHQVLSLAESLAVARRELEISSSRVLHLEELLMQERKAREHAETRARQLMENTDHPFEQGKADSLSETNSKDITLDMASDDAAETASIRSTSSQETLVAPENPFVDPAPAATYDDSPDASTVRDQLRVAQREVDEMKVQMERYRQRAEAAEEERSSLADMVARIREESQLSSKASSAATSPRGSPNKKKKRGSTAKESSSIEGESGNPADAEIESTTANGSAHIYERKGALLAAADGSSDVNDLAAAEDALRQVRLLQGAVATALERRLEDGRLVQVAPYASIVGVVLLGVGIMACLNGWQRVER